MLFHALLLCIFLYPHIVMVVGSRTKRQTENDIRLVHEFWNELLRGRNDSSNQGRFAIDQFHTYAEIYRYLGSLQSNNPGVVRSFPIGSSCEGRALQVVKIGIPSENQKKHTMWIDAGFHAREWAAVSTALYIIDQLVSSSLTDPEIRALLGRTDFYILPVANPDGYTYSWHNSSRRYWRKTRSPQGDTCLGVDPNRNFPYHWNESGTSGDPCMGSYPGPQSLSEPETQAVANYLRILKNYSLSLVYITLHAYARYWAVPYSYAKNTYPPNYSKMYEVATAAVQEIRSRTEGQNFLVTHSGNWYPAAGSSDDFAVGTLGLDYAYTIEVAPNAADSYSGFLLPPSRIIPTGNEAFIGIMSVCKQLFSNNTRTRTRGARYIL